LPGLSGFAGEFLILVGSWQTQPVVTAMSLLAIVIASAYALRLYQAAMHGEYRVPPGAPAAMELRPREILVVAPLLAAIIFLGVWPGWLTTKTAAPAGVPSHPAVYEVPRT